MNDESKPLSYRDWLASSGLSHTDDYDGYSKYLIKWYDSKKLPQNNIRSEYIQLLKEINFVFNNEKRDRFLGSINFNDTVDLINALPYFTSKIKEIAKSFNDKRNAIKKSKLKYSLISSKKGVETLLYEYVLNSFTSKNGISPVPHKELSGIIPELKNVNSYFYIEVEELYDKTNYYDRSSKLSPDNYTNSNTLANSFPYSGKLNRNQLIGVLSASLKERAASTPLSNVFLKFLTESSIVVDAVSEFDYVNAVNTISLNEKYMGNDLYALTAIKSQGNLEADFTTQLNIETGNNWFYWPSGDKVYSSDNIDNIYKPIEINNSNFILNGATGSGSFKTSDIILTDKKGYIEGAWLLGPRIEKSKKDVSFTVDPSENRQFIWPYTGFSLAKNTNQWRGFLTNDDSRKYFYFLSDKEKNIILDNYYTTLLPSQSSEKIYLNSTNFYKQGAYANETALDSDVIIKRNYNIGKNKIYNKEIGDTEISFLYKLEQTEIPISSGVNSIIWPFIKISTDEQNIPITITNDFCDPVELRVLNTQEAFKGAVAGQNREISDCIYKLEKRDGNPIEAAWLKSISINSLNSFKNEIPIYNSKPTCCEEPTEGSNQEGLYTVVPSGQRISFVWGDKDTPANEVFKYLSHQTNCEYDDVTREYYKDQDYTNPAPLTNNIDFWNLCTCKSVLYSPIGHKGDVFTDYDGMTDLLYTDPQGLLKDFDLSTWKDTRCLDYKSSPQFSFFKLNNINNPSEVGIGFGSWKTSSGKEMILKTGRRYTYFRTSFKKLDDSGPRLVVSYDYKDQSSFCSNIKPYDIILCVDVSFSQRYNLEINKKLVLEILKDKPANVQIGIIAFDSRQMRCSYLSYNPDYYEFENKILNYEKDISGFTYATNINDAISFANTLLTTEISENNKVIENDFKKLCMDVNASIVSEQRVPIFNLPNKSAQKRIIIISDGEETSDLAKDKNGKLILPSTASSLKSKSVEIQCIDVGAKSLLNNNLENIASPGLYFNLQKYLYTNDTDDVSRVMNDIVYKISGCGDTRSTWCKMIRDTNGDWIETNEYTDMILRPNDNLVYVHRENIPYSSPVNSYLSYQTPSKKFIIKVPLRGWNYSTNSYVKNDIIFTKGARPYWGKGYADPDNGTFNKEFMYMGGHIRWDDYLPLKQPEISDMVLEHGSFLEYVRRTTSRVKFTQKDVSFEEYKNNYQWNKLDFTKQYSNLNLFYKSDRLEYIAKPTYEKSDLVLESFYEFKQAQYNYYARSSFSFSQDLFLIYKCVPTYSEILTGKVLTAQNPYAHLDNMNYPSIALIPETNNFVTRKQTGYYLLPTKLGVPFFPGIGYNISLDQSKIFNFEKNKTEMLFLDPSKYGPITRGLSNIDNLSPTKVDYIDNRWMMVPYGSGEVSGMIKNTKNTQKFTPYQSEYEILGINQYGINRPTDNFQFYDRNRRWTAGGLNFRGEVSKDTFLRRRQRLLSDIGIITSWKMDLFGNNYALFKSKQDENYIEIDDSKVNYNDLVYDKERLSSDQYPANVQRPDDYENINYNSKEKDYLEFLIEE